ncbi:MAG: T9SS type A sorting domain-containing protein [Candidatus Cyclobacteriaceae bacterium M2_1C_046]
MRVVYFIILLFFLSGPAFGQFTTEPEKEKISFYPNPATTTLYVKVPDKNITSENIHVYNIIGNKLDLTVSKQEERKFSIEVENLPAGYYLLVIENKETQFTKTVKFLKK